MRRGQLQTNKSLVGSTQISLILRRVFLGDSGCIRGVDQFGLNTGEIGLGRARMTGAAAVPLERKRARTAILARNTTFVVPVIGRRAARCDRQR